MNTLVEHCAHSLQSLVLENMYRGLVSQCRLAAWMDPVLIFARYKIWVLAFILFRTSVRSKKMKILRCQYSALIHDPLHAGSAATFDPHILFSAHDRMRYIREILRSLYHA
jgi:hypothetical protein